MSTVAILGSAYAQHGLLGEPIDVNTPLGTVRLYRVHPQGYVLYRHEFPHRYLPNQIPYRAHALALERVGCTALLVTTSVGVLNRELPLFTPLLVRDVIMPDNRLPDGTACSLFLEPKPDQGHLVLEEGLISRALSRQVSEMARLLGTPVHSEVVFGYAMGPRTATAAETAYWRTLGAHVYSMTTAPELVLANELEIPCAALAIGHTYSFEAAEDDEGPSLQSSLDTAREVMATVVDRFVMAARPVPFGNQIHRF